MADDEYLLDAARAVRPHLLELAPVAGESIRTALNRLLNARPAGPAEEVAAVLRADARVWTWVQEWVREWTAQTGADGLPGAVPSPGGSDPGRVTFPRITRQGPLAVPAPGYSCPVHRSGRPWFRHSVADPVPKCPEPGCGRLFTPVD
ncbi:hypothetical protein GA0115240_101421 [Streptomyces sp. DvalAA-14]|uniref:hypothetical protein n=1 Tax=unclassified Streptomyces TaxID=2593676 RepID=UPI00081B0D3E|nr:MULTISPECIES: hypothetical protein [unclassified Streptomyces]MYS18863.1 hypothetical protein [Streptomyces sp. SID4948]SCD30760.1 hypothetical protein GA0115240_101421 [Streptomyces sp. DvalAA-14]